MPRPGDGTRLICPLVADEAGAMRRDMASAARQGADAVELRLDLLAEAPSREQLAELLAEPPLPVIATNRPVREGGRFDGKEADRLAILRDAARLGADYVDVELDVPEADRPGGPLILSHHDFSGWREELREVAASLDRSAAPVNKVVFSSAGPEDALRAFDLLRACRKPTIAIAMGDAGLPSRILAPKFGAFGTFAALAEGAESASGQPTVEQLRGLYRWDAIGAGTTAYGVIGSPVMHSMSPAIHNASFAAAGLDAVYVPLLVQPGREAFARFLDALREREWLNWRGLSVTLPHKENALAYVGPAACDELTVRIGAVNTLTLAEGGGLLGTNTDYAAAMEAVCGALGIGRADLAGRPVAVLGAGGVARAVVAVLAHHGAEVTVYNRTLRRGQQLASEFSSRSAPLDEAPDSNAEIVINCTPLGMHPEVDATPLARMPRRAVLVFDTIYNPPRTRLLRDAEAAGVQAVGGVEMFVNQAAAQFETWAGEPAPRDLMRRVVLERLGS
jgi:3-dehydroquinate dehydratase/shikimate dehydrogenase